MRSWILSALDWWVMQTARRYVLRRAGSMEGRSVVAPEPLSESDFLSVKPTVPSDLKCGADGSFAFTSPIPTASAQNNTVFGRLYRAEEPWAEHPTVILLHGWNAEICYHKLFPSLAGRFRSAAINVVSVQLPYHMQRRPRSGPVTDFISTDLGGMLQASRQAVADIRALMAWLQAQGSPALGLWGFSLGAWLAGLISRWEPSLAAAVLTTPIARMDRAIAELPFCQPVRQSLGERAFEFGELNLAARPPRMPIRNILLVQSRHDLFAPAETIEELWSSWGRPEIWRLSHGHISVLLSGRVMGRTVGWIQDRMGASLEGQRPAAPAALLAKSAPHF